MLRNNNHLIRPSIKTYTIEELLIKESIGPGNNLKWLNKKLFFQLTFSS